MDRQHCSQTSFPFPLALTPSFFVGWQQASLSGLVTGLAQPSSSPLEAGNTAASHVLSQGGTPREAQEAAAKAASGLVKRRKGTSIEATKTAVKAALRAGAEGETASEVGISAVAEAWGGTAEATRVQASTTGNSGKETGLAAGAVAVVAAGGSLAEVSDAAAWRVLEATAGSVPIAVAADAAGMAAASAVLAKDGSTPQAAARAAWIAVRQHGGSMQAQVSAVATAVLQAGKALVGKEAGLRVGEAAVQAGCSVAEVQAAAVQGALSSGGNLETAAIAAGESVALLAVSRHGSGGGERAASLARGVVKESQGSIQAQAAVAGFAVYLAGGTPLEAGAAAAKVVKEDPKADTAAVVSAAGQAAAAAVIQAQGWPETAAEAAHDAAMAAGASKQKARLLAGDAAGMAALCSIDRSRGSAAGEYLASSVLVAGGSVDQVAASAALGALKAGATACDAAEVAGRCAAKAAKEGSLRERLHEGALKQIRGVLETNRITVTASALLAWRDKSMMQRLKNAGVRQIVSAFRHSVTHGDRRFAWGSMASNFKSASNRILASLMKQRGVRRLGVVISRHMDQAVRVVFGMIRLAWVDAGEGELQTRHTRLEERAKSAGMRRLGLIFARNLRSVEGVAFLCMRMGHEAHQDALSEALRLEALAEEEREERERLHQEAIKMQQERHAEEEASVLAAWAKKSDGVSRITRALSQGLARLEARALLAFELNFRDDRQAAAYWVERNRETAQGLERVLTRQIKGLQATVVLTLWLNLQEGKRALQEAEHRALLTHQESRLLTMRHTTSMQHLVRVFRAMAQTAMANAVTALKHHAVVLELRERGVHERLRLREDAAKQEAELGAALETEAEKAIQLEQELDQAMEVLRDTGNRAAGRALRELGRLLLLHRRGELAQCVSEWRSQAPKWQSRTLRLGRASRQGQRQVRGVALQCLRRIQRRLTLDMVAASLHAWRDHSWRDTHPGSGEPFSPALDERPLYTHPITDPHGYFPHDAWEYVFLTQHQELQLKAPSPGTGYGAAIQSAGTLRGADVVELVAEFLELQREFDQKEAWRIEVAGRVLTLSPGEEEGAASGFEPGEGLIDTERELAIISGDDPFSAPTAVLAHDHPAGEVCASLTPAGDSALAGGFLLGSVVVFDPSTLREETNALVGVKPWMLALAAPLSFPHAAGCVVVQVAEDASRGEVVQLHTAHSGGEGRATREGTASPLALEELLHQKQDEGRNAGTGMLQIQLTELQADVERLKEAREKESEDPALHEASRYRREALVGIFRSLDQEGKGSLAQRQLFGLGTKAGVWDEAMNQNLIAIMATNGQALIRVEEFVAHFDKMLPKPKKAFDASINAMDLVANRGAQRRERGQELTALRQSQQIPGTLEFDEVDVDGDGVISRNEYAAAAAVVAAAGSSDDGTLVTRLDDMELTMSKLSFKAELRAESWNPRGTMEVVEEAAQDPTQSGKSATSLGSLMHSVKRMRGSRGGRGGSSG